MKIALLGSAPSSLGLAPFDDGDWTIWGCSPGAYPHLKRLDAFFEIHRWTPGQGAFTPDYIEWLKGLDCPVYMIEKTPDVPASLAYPQDEILAKYPGFGRSFFTSSLAWMLALAIEAIQTDRFIVDREAGGDEIGLWGVDMAAADEYGLQKPGCHFFMREAEKHGIKISVPPQSDLLRPVALYGIGEASPMRIKMDVRRQELMNRMAEVQQRAQAADRAFQDATREQCFLQGALDNMTYFEQTWS